MLENKIPHIDLNVSQIGLGTWVMGGWMWGGAEDAQSVDAVCASVENGVTLIDTAPVYGFGRSEEVVGRALKHMKNRDQVIIATKCGLEWNEQQTSIRRNSSPERLRHEIEASRRRLGVETIDLYQIHWPDESVAFEKTMETLMEFKELGWIRAIGLSNFNVGQMRECLLAGSVHTLQPPYNLFEREAEEDLFPFCREVGIKIISYGALCRGLLTGKFYEGSAFREGDVRAKDPKFQKENLEQYLNAIKRLKPIADAHKVTLGQLALLWTVAQEDIGCALAGARTREQAVENAFCVNGRLSEADCAEIEKIVEEEVKAPITPAFMGPPRSQKV